MPALIFAKKLGIVINKLEFIEEAKQIEDEQ
jgi:hypothetical protein